MENSTDFEKAFQNTPEELQKYIISSAFDDDIQNLAISEKLPPESFQPLKNIVFSVLINVAEAYEFRSAIEENFSLTEKTADKIIDDINTLVEKVIEGILDKSNEIEVKDIAVPGDSTSTDLRTTLLQKGEPAALNGAKSPAPVTQKTFVGSRSMLMDQLSLIGQIPKDEDVMTRLNKIKEQLRKGEEEKKKLDAEIKAREEKEKYKHALKPTTTVPRKVYDIDPYREQVEEMGDESVV